MKRIFCLLVCLLTCWITPVLADINLESMSFSELTELQSSVETEIRTRNVEKLDLKSLATNELEELILQSFYEMCSREEFVGQLSGSSAKSFQSLFGKGIQLIFSDVKGIWYTIELTDQNIALGYKTKIELTAEEIAKINIAP